MCYATIIWSDLLGSTDKQVCALACNNMYIYRRTFCANNYKYMRCIGRVHGDLLDDLI
jgi:hypothetical protein